MKFNQSLKVFHAMAAAGQLEQAAHTGRAYATWSLGRRWIIGLFDKCYDPF